LTIGLFFELLLLIAHLVSSNISEKPVSTHFSIEEEHTTHANKTKDGVTRTPLKTGGESGTPEG
jgi:hypothetical protein